MSTSISEAVQFLQFLAEQPPTPVRLTAEERQLLRDARRWLASHTEVDVATWVRVLELAERNHKEKP